VVGHHEATRGEARVSCDPQRGYISTSLELPSITTLSLKHLLNFTV